MQCFFYKRIVWVSKLTKEITKFIQTVDMFPLNQVRLLNYFFVLNNISSVPLCRVP